MHEVGGAVELKNLSCTKAVTAYQDLTDALRTSWTSKTKTKIKSVQDHELSYSLRKGQHNVR